MLYKMLSINKGQDGRPGRDADEGNAGEKAAWESDVEGQSATPNAHALSTRRTNSSPLSHKERNLNLIEKHNLRGWEVNAETSNFKVYFLRSYKVQKLYKSEGLVDTLFVTEKNRMLWIL